MKKLSENLEIAEKRQNKDSRALAKLEAWCKPLSMTVHDDGWELSLRLLGSRVYIFAISRDSVRYRGRQTIAAAANKLSQAIVGGTKFIVSFSRTVNLDDGSQIHDNRDYSFEIPKSSSPEELTLKIDLAGWKPPKDVWNLK